MVINKALAERTLAMLRALQWAGHSGGGCETCDYGAAMCPECYRSEDNKPLKGGSGHTVDCKLWKLIEKLEEALETQEPPPPHERSYTRWDRDYPEGTH